MERREPKVCAYEGKVYPHGSDECIKSKCMICADGEWRERIDACTFPTV